mmetsp:Transcript_19802/g.27839  ORF Transcript_19802/g.27839 Transcript_19802/m.27839 type:complete len:328 (-) Transcript_19802:1372-2355(-)
MDNKSIFPITLRNCMLFTKLIFNGKCTVSSLIMGGIMIFRPPFGCLDATKSHITGGGGSMKCGTCAQGCGMIETSIERIHVTTTPYDACLMLPTPHPFPYVSRHIVESIVVGGIMLDGGCPPPSILGMIGVGESTLSPEIGMEFGHVHGGIVAPCVERPIGGSNTRGPCGGLPFPFSGKSLTLPGTILGRISVGNVDDGMILTVFVGSVGTLGMTPVGPVYGGPVCGIGIDVDVSLFEHGPIGQEGGEDEGPAELFGFRLIIGGAHEFAEFPVGDGCNVHEEGIDVHDEGWIPSSIQGMRFVMSKGFGSLGYFVRISMSLFSQDLFP